MLQSDPKKLPQILQSPLGARGDADDGRIQAGSTIFHQQWWLEAATRGDYFEAIVRNGNLVVGRLPYVAYKKMGMTTLRMPPITHSLGPAVQEGEGKPQTRLMRRLSIVRGLIDQLPRHDFFKQALGTSIADGLAFQERGFQIAPQYNFEIDGRANLTKIWDAMHFKVRQHIRRAEEKLTVTRLDDPTLFLRFYLDNLVVRGLRPFARLDTFVDVYAACSARKCGEILCASWPDGKPAAMVFLVWGGGRMYYLLSTRARESGDNGSVNLLIWNAAKRAHELGAIFDLDGVYSSGAARFLSGFGGEISCRLIVQRISTRYHIIRYAKRHLVGGKADQTVNFS